MLTKMHLISFFKTLSCYADLPVSMFFSTDVFTYLQTLPHILNPRTHSHRTCW